MPWIFLNPISFIRRVSRLWCFRQVWHLNVFWPCSINQEDVNGEKLTVKKWWIFGADFSRSTQSFSRFIRDTNGEKKTSRY